MKIRLLNLPPAVTETGYLFALELSDGVVKIGTTKTPAKTVATHACIAVKSGVEVSDVWISAPHSAYIDTVDALVAMAATLAGEPEPMNSLAAEFAGVNFNQLIGVCRQLCLNEPAASPATTSHEMPKKQGESRGPSNVVRMLPCPQSSDLRRTNGDQRGADFAGLVFAARNRAGLTQEETEERSGVSRATLSRWERGQVGHPEADHIRSLCRTIGLNAIDAMSALGYLEADDFQHWESA